MEKKSVVEIEKKNVGEIEKKYIDQKWIQKSSKREISLLVLIAIILLACLTLLLIKRCCLSNTNITVVSFTEDEKDAEVITPSALGGTTTDDLNKLNSSSPELKILSRMEWLAQPPVEPPIHLKSPVPYVIIWHTATEDCTNQASCIYAMRNIQSFHIESRHWFDIAYNFVIGGDGSIYEGRGWTSKGSHTYSYNSKSIGIAFIGTFISVKPPKWQIDACKSLIEMGVVEGYIAKDYKVLAAKQIQATQAPGSALFEDLKTWPHWSDSP